MIKTIFSAILILTTISCASLMDFEGVYRSDGSAVVDPDPYDPSLDLLLGLYYYSLISPSYYRSSYYLPPPASLSPIYRYLWIQSEIENNLRNYENEVWWINFREKMKLEDEARRLMDDLKRAKKD